jgi:hypothetical protein
LPLEDVEQPPPPFCSEPPVSPSWVVFVVFVDISLVPWYESTLVWTFSEPPFCSEPEPPLGGQGVH